MIAEGMES